MSWAELPVHRRAKTFHAVSKCDVSGFVVGEISCDFLLLLQKTEQDHYSKKKIKKILLIIEQLLAKDFFGSLIRISSM